MTNEQIAETDAGRLERIRAFEIDHTPDGWPAIKMKDVSWLLDLVEQAAEKIRLLEEELESHAWEISPAMAQAKIDSLNEQLATVAGERDRYREALEKALPRMAHRFECVSVLPSEMWHQNGSVSLDSCKCEIKIVKSALEVIAREAREGKDENEIQKEAGDCRSVAVVQERRSSKRLRQRCRWL